MQSNQNTIKISAKKQPKNKVKRDFTKHKQRRDLRKLKQISQLGIFSEGSRNDYR